MGIEVQDLSWGKYSGTGLHLQFILGIFAINQVTVTVQDYIQVPCSISVVIWVFPCQCHAACVTIVLVELPTSFLWECTLLQTLRHPQRRSSNKTLSRCWGESTGRKALLQKHGLDLQHSPKSQSWRCLLVISTYKVSHGSIHSVISTQGGRQESTWGFLASWPD